MSSGKPIIRNGSTTKRLEAQKTLGEVGALKAEYSSCTNHVDQLIDTLQNEEEKLDRIQLELYSTREKLSFKDEEIDMNPLPEGAQPVERIQARDKLRMMTKQLEAAVNSQRSCVKKAKEDLREGQHKLFESEKNLHQYVDAVEGAEKYLSDQQDDDFKRSSKLVKYETKRAQKWEEKQKEAVDQQAKRVRDFNKKAQKQVEATETLHKQAAKRVCKSNLETLEVTNKIQEMKEKLLLDRIDAVLELKDNQDAVRAQVATKAAKYVSRIENEQKRLEEEKADLVAAGLNPYAVFRKRAIDAEAAAKEARLKSLMEKNKLEIETRLAEEQRAKEKEVEKMLREKAYEKKYREELGPHVTEERNKKYIMDMTTDHVDILDASGRAARIDPSKITDIADKSFGLGKSARVPAPNMARITEKIRATLKVDRDDIGEYKRMVASLVPENQLNSRESIMRSTSAPTGTELVGRGEDVAAVMSQTTGANAGNNAKTAAKLRQLQSLASTSGPVPGAKGAALTVNLDDEEEMAERLLKISAEEVDGEATAMQGGLDPSSDKSPKYKLPEQTKFEQTAFEKAKERQKNRQLEGTTQVAGGRVFEGAGFLSKPGLIDFTDFEVGQHYKKSFVLTNVSYTFNSFRFVPMPDEVVDFFEIHYPKPGRMSAGISCTLEVRFHPQLNNDIDTAIKLRTETGPIDIPIRCRIKKCFPRLMTSDIDSGTVTIGQKTQTEFKVKNTGALPSTFRIVRVTESKLSLKAKRISYSEELDAATAVDDVGQEDGGNLISSEPALTESDLMARVRRAVTQVERKKRAENPNPVTLPTEGKVNGYGESSVSVVCAPLVKGGVREEFSVIFDDVRDVDLSTDQEGLPPLQQEQRVVVHFTAEDIPVYVAEEVADLKCTLYGRIYRRRVELRNRSGVSCKVTLKVPSPLNKYVELTPTMVFVQGGGSQSLNLKFTPTPELLTDMVHYTVLRQGFVGAALVTLPVELKIVGQELPVYFTLRSEVCQSNLKFSSTVLDLGKIFVHQQSTIQLVVTNTSRLAQKVAFVKLRHEFTVTPNDGFGALLPNESMTFEITLSPTSAIVYDTDLVISTSLNDTYSIRVLGTGFDPPVTIDDPIIRMRSAAPGERLVESTWVRNKTNVVQVIEIAHPDPRFSWMKVSPSTIELEPNGRCRVEFEFCPPDNVVSLDPAKWIRDQSAATKSPFSEVVSSDQWLRFSGLLGEVQWSQPEQDGDTKEEGKAEDGETKQSSPRGSEDDGDEGEDGPSTPLDEEGDNGPAKEDWAVVGRWSFPIWIRPPKLRGGATTAAGGGRSEAHSANSLPLVVGINTVVMKAELSIATNILDFGQTAVGTRQVKTVRIRNLSKVTIDRLEVKGCNACGPFNIMNPLKPLEAGEWTQVIIECNQREPGLIVEVLDIGSANGGHRLKLTLKTQGVNPAVRIKGLDPGPPGFDNRGGIVDFGNVVALDVASRKFVIENSSAFPVNITTCRAASDGLPPAKAAEMMLRSSAGMPLFSFRPEAAVIGPQKSLEVEVTFRPDQGSLAPLREDFSIQLGKPDDVISVCVCGRSWARQLFVTAADPTEDTFTRPSVSASPVDVYENIASAEIRKQLLDARKALGMTETKPTPLLLEFEDPYGPGFDPNVAEPEPVTAKSAPPKAAGKKGGDAVPVVTGRTVSKSVLVNCVKIFDNRAAAAGSFELLMGAPARDSGLFALSLDKGAVAVGAQVPVEITCTLPRPRGIGGLQVGSWQSFSADLVLRGGWKRDGDAEDFTLPIELKAFIRL